MDPIIKLPAPIETPATDRLRALIAACAEADAKYRAASTAHDAEVLAAAYAGDTERVQALAQSAPKPNTDPEQALRREASGLRTAAWQEYSALQVRAHTLEVLIACADEALYECRRRQDDIHAAIEYAENLPAEKENT
jgi:hypothetical protein